MLDAQNCETFGEFFVVCEDRATLVVVGEQLPDFVDDSGVVPQRLVYVDLVLLDYLLLRFG
jgi:hypothetical protein